MTHPQPLPAAPSPNRRQALAAALGLVLTPVVTPTHANPPRPDPLRLTLRDTTFVHRWSRQGQHEFTPPEQPDLNRWRDMLTLNLHASVQSGEQLAGVANQVLGNYQRHGKILQTRSVPRTADRPAEHLIVAVLGNPQLLEAVFARCRLHDGAGLVAVVSHRVYGSSVGPLMSTWLRQHGPALEQALMAWEALPAKASLQRLERGSA